MIVQDCLYNNNSNNLDVCDLSCELCHSSEIRETQQGYVCAECGCVLDLPILKYHVPYTQKKIHYEVSVGNTFLGLQKERRSNRHSPKLKRLHKLQCSQSYQDMVYHDTEIEICRILAGLDLPHTFKDPIFKTFKELWGNYSQRSRFQSIEKLIPVLIYYFCKKQYISINEHELLEIAKVNRKQYIYYKLKFLAPPSAYKNANRKKLIKSKLFRLAVELGLGMDFYHDAVKLLNKLYKEICCTKESVIAGLISSIVVLCRYREEITVNSICNYFNIAMSTIQSRVKRHFIEKFKVVGFESLVKSAHIIKTTIYKLGIFEEPSGEQINEPFKELYVTIETNATEESEEGDFFSETLDTPKIIQVKAIYRNLRKRFPRLQRSYNCFLFILQNRFDLHPIFISLLLPTNSIMHILKQNGNKAILKRMTKYLYPSKGPP